MAEANETKTDAFLYQFLSQVTRTHSSIEEKDAIA